MDDEFPHNNTAIMTETALPYSFVKRCNAELPLLAAYRLKKDKNQIFYNNNGLIVWRTIRTLYEKEKTMPQIREHLESTFGSKETDQDNKQETNGSAQESVNPGSVGRVGHTRSEAEMFMDFIREQAKENAKAWKEAAEGHKNDSLSKEKTIKDLEGKLLALPDGRTPVQITQDLKEKDHQERELEKLREEHQRKEAAAEEVKKLLADLENIKGWGKGKERASLIRKIISIQL